jgi:uncharacterized pyridoxal phosphate-containing UPF0001 family protein
VITALIQVSLEGQDGDPGRGGAPLSEVTGLAEAIAAEENATKDTGDPAGGLRLGGVMAVAPLGAPAAGAFAGLAACSAAVRSVNPEATMISAGMSGDLEEAVEAGATHLRIGTALLGDRKPPVM